MTLQNKINKEFYERKTEDFSKIVMRIGKQVVDKELTHEEGMFAIMNALCGIQLLMLHVLLEDCE